MAAPAPHWLTRALLAAVCLALSFSLWRHYGPPDPRRAFPTGEIVFGVDGSHPPFALADGATLRGLEIDLARAIARELNLAPRFVNSGYYGLSDALVSGRVDAAIAGLRVEPSRTQDLRYTQAYFDAGIVIVAADGESRLALEEFAGERIAYEFASGADGLLRARQSEGFVFEPLPYELPGYALDSLRLGLAEAALVDATSWLLHRRQAPDWGSRFAYVAHEPYVIALRFDRVDAWKLLERALSALKASGELARIVDAWL